MPGHTVINGSLIQYQCFIQFKYCLLLTESQNHNIFLLYHLDSLPKKIYSVQKEVPNVVIIETITQQGQGKSNLSHDQSFIHHVPITMQANLYTTPSHS
jgi:hypothetical protein